MYYNKLRESSNLFTRMHIRGLLRQKSPSKVHHSTYTCLLSNSFPVFLDSEECNVQIWMLWNSVSDALRTVSNKLSSCGSAIAVDGLCIATLGVVVCSL
jgi:hypothetical protein